MDYKEAGVDISTGDALVSWLKQEQLKKRRENKIPHQDKLISGIGGFSALFKADFSQYKEPCLVSATDGIGTKILVALKFNDFSSIGQDLVAMCVNDLICCGADPLFFLDYYATGKLKLEPAKDFLRSIQNACEESNCTLIGGETAEMPGLYSNNDFDCAGFSVGIVDRLNMFGQDKVQSGDTILGIESTGFHSNGYSLVRKLFEADLDDWKDEILVPTRLYVSLVDELKKHFPQDLHSMAHITGGGMDNLLRVVPKASRLTLKSWDFSPLYLETQKRSGLTRKEMLKTFNCGWGFALVVSQNKSDEFIEFIKNLGIKSACIGSVSFEIEKNKLADSSWICEDES